MTIDSNQQNQPESIVFVLPFDLSWFPEMKISPELALSCPIDDAGILETTRKHRPFCRGKENLVRIFALCWGK
jgi:hypothetical protein